MTAAQRNERAAHWLIGFEDTLSAQKQAEFAAWYAEPRNAAAFVRMKAGWERLGLWSAWVRDTPAHIQRQQLGQVALRPHLVEK